MDLVIALEMSRLQMIEDRMRKVSEDSLDRSIVDVLENLNDSTNRPGTSEAFVRNSKNGMYFKIVEAFYFYLLFSKTNNAKLWQ